jgi:hypothetical protein
MYSHYEHCLIMLWFINALQTMQNIRIEILLYSSRTILFKEYREGSVSFDLYCHIIMNYQQRYYTFWYIKCYMILLYNFFSRYRILLKENFV